MLSPIRLFLRLRVTTSFRFQLCATILFHSMKQQLNFRFGQLTLTSTLSNNFILLLMRATIPILPNATVILLQFLLRLRATTSFYF